MQRHVKLSLSCDNVPPAPARSSNRAAPLIGKFSHFGLILSLGDFRGGGGRGYCAQVLNELRFRETPLPPDLETGKLPIKGQSIDCRSRNFHDGRNFGKREKLQAGLKTLGTHCSHPFFYEKRTSSTFVNLHHSTNRKIRQAFTESFKLAIRTKTGPPSPVRRVIARYSAPPTSRAPGGARRKTGTTDIFATAARVKVLARL